MLTIKIWSYRVYNLSLSHLSLAGRFFMNRKRIILTSGLVVLAIFLWLTHKIPYCGWDFHNSLWGPVNMLVNHQTPYTFNAPYGPYPSVWMPTILGAFFLFGYLPCDILAKLWLFVELAGYIWIIWLIAGNKMPARWIFVTCLIVFAFFPPLWLHIHLGQFSMLFATMMIAIIYLPGTERYWPLLLVLGLTKPQLTILVYPGIFIHVWRTKGFRKAFQLVLFTVLCAGILLIPVFAFYPNWVKDFLFITFGNFDIGWDLPTLFVQLPYLMGKIGYGIWGFVALISLTFSCWIWIKKDAKIAVLVSLALTPMVTTYASSWDFLLLIPLFFWLMIWMRSKSAHFILLFGMASLFIIQIALRWHRDYPDGRQWWLPPALLLVFLVSVSYEYINTARPHLFRKVGGIRG
jgi:hypothetical protein